MEEEPIENDLEERMYAALHYVDDTQPDITNQKSSTPIFDNAQQSTIRRYWRTNENVTSYNKSYNNKPNTSYSKVNTPNVKETDKSETKCNEKLSSEQDGKLSMFQLPIPSNLKPTIEILDTEVKSCVVELETSDEDEVIEVELPPKPTITIESSDEEDVITNTEPTKENKVADEKLKSEADRVTSPVPSVVSSISDEFIRGDCIALNITSKNNHSTLDSTTLYSALGSDQEQTPAKKNKKKRKTKDATSTPVSTKSTTLDECFATPKSKTPKEKNKKQKTKSYQVTHISIPSADVYDSDSNQSIVETSKPTSYKVTDRSLPSTDVYETDSNHSENQANLNKSNDIMVSDVDSSEHLSETENVVTPQKVPERRKSVIDLTESRHDESVNIEESIVMANVTGFSDNTITIENHLDKGLDVESYHSKCGSTKIPAILYEDLDFDNLKGNKVAKKRKYSLTALRAEMEKFYNESWGGENFNHREIQKNMSRDKSLWAIDPKDRMPALAKRKTMCNVCNRVGHRDDTCRLKTPICHMCGVIGHYEPRCPKKICVNCGSPNHVYTTMCRNCCNWHAIRCAECGQHGHPASHCPDVWRRYHNTISSNVPLEENRQTKRQNQMFCSGCTRRGHLVHTCRLSIPFGELPIYSPYVVMYRPVYRPTRDLAPQAESNKHKQQKKNDFNTPKSDRNKRQSKSPVSHEFQNKKRNLGTPDDAKSTSSEKQRKNSQSKENKNSSVEVNKAKQSTDKKESDSPPDYIAVSSSNHDEKGQVIQDNEVSDTSEVITSARIYITNEIVDSLKTTDGCEWLKQASARNKIVVENTDKNFYISIKGTVGNQEVFQTELRDWIKSKQPKEPRASESDANSTADVDEQTMCDNIPKNRNNVLRKIKGALESLKADIGDPKALYKELTYLQNRQQQLMKQHVVSPKQLSNNRGNIRMMQRKLNMVLLGQAGLADGTKHVNELCSLQEKVTNYRNKSIPPSLRQEIGEHFHTLFTTPRDDYQQLVNMYYNRSPVKALTKVKRKKLKMTPDISQNRGDQFTPSKEVNQDETNGSQLSKMKRRLFKNTKSKLMFFKKRLENTKPADPATKTAMGRVMRDLQRRISSFDDIEKCSNQDVKKSKRTQLQAKQLLRSLEMTPATAGPLVKKMNVYRIFNVPISRVYTVLAVLFWFTNFITARRFNADRFYPDVDYDGQQYANINAALQNLEHEPEWVPDWPNPSVKLGQVSGVAIDPSGHVLVFHRAANEWNDRTFNLHNVYQNIGEPPIPEPTILVYNETGELVDSWGQNLFHMPHGITVDGQGNVWVTDVALHQVFKFTPNEKKVPAFIMGQKFEPGDDDQHYCKPTSVAVMSSGEFFVADGYCNARIIKYAPDGSKLLEWGKLSGTSQYSLLVPHALALAEDRGELCVANRERGRVSCYSATDGTFRASFSNWLLGQRLFSVAYSPLHGGRLYVVNGAGYPPVPVRGYVIDYTTGRLVATFAPPGGLRSPHDVCVTRGAVYVAELERRVLKFTENDTFTPPPAKPTATVELHGNVTMDKLTHAGWGWDAWGAWGAVAGAAAAAVALIALARARHAGRKGGGRRRWEYVQSEFKLRRLLERRRFTRVHSDDSDDEPAPMLPAPTA
ncbi:uncharacterized protein LOC121730726 [Aricia agestis]|uniref:uncharacterized protein LOC121730726 n=1 Tax=Aricia agestis TaxID=91739 RepID=UPI001C2099E0|nr:uncharacterized protein LOC121730726 [Aricia agestis]